MLFMVLCRSYSLTLGTLFLSVFVISVFTVLTYIHCAHLHASALLVSLGGTYRESLGDNFSLYQCFLYFDILSPYS
jgi:hypothetical protein